MLIFAALFSSLCFAQGADSLGAERGVLSVQSVVPAGVWLGGKPVGSTPFSMGLPAGWHSYSVRAHGYWTETFIAGIKPGATVLSEVNLKRIELPALEALDISHEKNVKRLEASYDSIAALKTVSTPDSVCVATFAREFPLMAPVPEGLAEQSPEYKEYYSIYDSEKMLSFKEWHSGCSLPVQQNLDAIKTRIDELGAGHLSGYVPVIAARFDPAAADGLRGTLVLIFRSKDRRADVAWRGEWDNSFLTGNELVRALTADEPAALSFLTAQNQAAWIPSDSGYSRHLYKYYALNISWNGLLIPMSGEFVLPDYLIAQPAVAEWLAGKPQDTATVAEPEPPAPDTAAPLLRTGIARIPGGALKYKGSDIEVRPFSINSTQIIQKEYSAICGKKNFSAFAGDSLPAHSVTWNEANSCCKALGGELPSEAEWEYAATGGTPRDSAIGEYAVFGESQPAKIASKKPNGWGLYDMFGNVSEWVKDEGFWSGKYRFLKGGSYKSKEKDLKIEKSQEEDARYWGHHVGFRCVYRD